MASVKLTVWPGVSVPLAGEATTDVTVVGGTNLKSSDVPAAVPSVTQKL
jgi:hypothetical protein